MAVGKTGPLGPLAPRPARSSPEAVKKRACDGTVIDLGLSSDTHVAAAFGPQSGLVAWSISPTRLALRILDRRGKPLGEANEVDVPAPVNSTYGVRALDGHYIVFLSASDFSASPILKLYALATDIDGKPTSGVLQVAIGDRGLIDEISPGAAHGVLVWAGATPATKIDKARLISLVVDDKGALAQSFIDYPDPLPGDRVRPFFSFSSDHAVVLAGSKALVVDGEMKPQKSTFDPDGIELAPSFTGATVPILGLGLGNNGKTMRYGTVALDGTLTFDAKDTLKTATPRAPFESHVTWGMSTDSNGTSVWGSASSSAELVTSVPLPPPLNAGILTVIEWTGEQLLVFAGDRTTMRVGALPCGARTRPRRF